MTHVSLVRGEDRREIIRRSLELIDDDIKQRLASKQPVIKPNLVSSTIQLASSHVDQVRGVLDFLTSVYHGTVIIAEASCYDTKDAYRNFGYIDLPSEYPVELVDLNDGPFENITVSCEDGKALNLRAASLLLDADSYVISAAKMKTHDTVIVSLSIKNLAMGCIFSDDKKSVHQGIRGTNRIIADIAEHVWPDLSVIDGHEGMEGDGPTRGEAVPLGIAVSSTDALAADRVVCEIMGVDFHTVGYLHYCSERGLRVRSEKNRGPWRADKRLYQALSVAPQCEGAVRLELA
jgi:uncharacterized protein (DUF362 family)